MTAATPDQVADFGAPLVRHIVAELEAVPSAGFEHMAEIRNLAGADTGFAHVWQADRITKITHLSINIMPGARYFNIVVAPDAHFDIPRFAHEGMITTRGSQVSLDLYHDIDVAEHIAAFVRQTAPLTAIYDAAQASDIAFVPSRQVHMRAFCSPHFLNVFGATGEQLPTLADYAQQYFAAWLTLYRAAVPVTAAEASERLRRRRHMADSVIEFDPDRDMVVQVYGEDTVRAIEETVMY